MGGRGRRFHTVPKRPGREKIGSREEPWANSFGACAIEGSFAQLRNTASLKRGFLRFLQSASILAFQRITKRLGARRLVRTCTSASYVSEQTATVTAWARLQ